jgi:hypothetical protein
MAATRSIEMRCGTRLLLFDGGSGIRYLGNQLVAEAPLDADLFLTHTHFDHVCGLPFFRPFFQPQNTFRLWAGHLAGQVTLRRRMNETMSAPLFPVPPEVFRASLSYHDFVPGETLTPVPGIVVRTALLNHPDRASGYRVDYAGAGVLSRDTEHVPVFAIATFRLIAGRSGDYDSMCTDESTPTVAGWGPDLTGRCACASGGARPGGVSPRSGSRRRWPTVHAEVEAALPGSVRREGLVLRRDYLYGSAASRRPSPKKLNASTTTNTGTTGSISHG